MRVLFDVDGTLVTWGDEVVAPMVEVLTALYLAGHEIFVASGGGQRYAADWCSMLGISGIVTVVEKGSDAEMRKYGFDLSFDDEVVGFALVNLQVHGAQGEPAHPKIRYNPV